MKRIVVLVLFIALLVGLYIWFRASQDNANINQINQNSAAVKVQERYDIKIVYVYDENIPQSAYENHCGDLGGVFNSCGSTCAPDSEVCTAVCGYICELGVINENIKLTSPKPQEKISSPLIITGEARGPWYFEASFPVILTDWDGKIIAEHYAEAQGDWMTEDFVPFKAELVFDSPVDDDSPDFMRKGSLILKKDNPSGLPEYDDAIEIMVKF